MPPKKQTSEEIKAQMRVFESELAALKALTTFHPFANTIRTYKFKMHNPNNSDLHCLFYAFSRGYYDLACAV